MGSRGFSVRLSSRWYLCTWKNPICAPPHLSEIPQRWLWNGSNVWLTMALSHPFKEDRLALPLSTPLSSRWSVVSHHLALCPQVMSQASQHFWSSEKQATCEDCFARQSACSVVSLPLRGFLFTLPPHPHPTFSPSLDCCHPVCIVLLPICPLTYLSHCLSLLLHPHPPHPNFIYLFPSLPSLSFPHNYLLFFSPFYLLSSFLSPLSSSYSHLPSLSPPPPPLHPPFLSLPPLSFIPLLLSL